MPAAEAEEDLAQVSAPVAAAPAEFLEGEARALVELAPAEGQVRRVKAAASGKAAEQVPVREAV